MKKLFYLLILSLLLFSGCTALNHQNIKALPGGHTKPVVGLNYSSSGKYFVTGAYDNCVKVWRTATNKVIEDLNVHYAAVYAVSFSESEKFVASGDKAGKIIIWNWKDNHITHTIDAHKSYINRVLFIKDDKFLASCGKEKKNVIKIWDIETGKLINELSGHTKEITSLIFSKDKNILISADISGKILLWDSDKFELIKNFDSKERIQDIVLSPDSSLLATASWNGELHLFSFPELKPLDRIIAHKGPVGSLSFNENGDLLASVSWDNYLKIWDIKLKKNKVKIHIPESDRLLNVKFNPDGSDTLLVSLWHNFFSETEFKKLTLSDLLNEPAIEEKGSFGLQLWNIKEKTLLKSFFPETSTQLAMSVSTDNKWMVVSSQQTGISIWENKSSHGDAFKFVDRIDEKREIVSISFHPDNKKFAYTTYNGFINIYSIVDKMIIDRFCLIEYLEEDSAMTSLCYSPDGRNLVAMGGKTLFLFAVDSMQLRETKKLKGKTQKHKTIRFHPSGCFYAYLNNGMLNFKKAKMCAENSDWGIADKKLVLKDAAIKAFDISPDGNYITLIDNKLKVRVFTFLNSKNANEIISWDFPAGKSKLSNGKVVQYNHGGDVVAVGDYHGNIAFFNLMKLQPLLKIDVSDRLIYDIRFSPDDTLVYTTGGDSRINIYKLPSGTLDKKIVVNRDGSEN